MSSAQKPRLAMYWAPSPKAKEDLVCQLCPHHCTIAPGQAGLCRVRSNQNGQVETLIYGAISSIALDPVEKKPLYHFYPGSSILSLGTIGCNFRCPFCQNWSISQEMAETQSLTPEEIVELVDREAPDCIGVAFTYSEPMVWYEYVLDTAKLLKASGYQTVLVTNGFIEEEPLRELLPFVDAMNIDVKSFREPMYRKVLGGALEPVKRTVELAAQQVHVEITTLLVPGQNDSPEELKELAQWAAAIDKAMPLHLSRYFPRYKLAEPATPMDTMLRAYEIAKEYLHYVYLGNTPESGRGTTTYCPECQAPLIERHGFRIVKLGLSDDRRCRVCGRAIELVD